MPDLPKVKELELNSEGRQRIYNFWDDPERVDTKHDEVEKRRKIISDYVVLGKNATEIKEIIQREHGIDIAVRTVQDDIQKMREYYKLRASKNIDEERSRDLHRLEAAIDMVMESILNGELKDVPKLVMLMDRKSKMLGMDAPARIDITDVISRKAEMMGLDFEKIIEDSREYFEYIGHK